MILGRIVMGFAECAIVTTFTLITYFFKDQWLSIASGVIIAWGQLGSVTAFLAGPLLLRESLLLSLGMTVAFGFFTLITCSLLFIIDYCCLGNLTSVSKSVEKMKFSDLKQLSEEYWLVCLASGLITASVISTFAFGTLYLTEVDDLPLESAGYVISAAYCIVLVAPLGSFLMDKYGHKCEIWVLCGFNLTICFLVLGINGPFPIIWFLLIGVSFAMSCSSLYGSVPSLVDPNIIGTGYGLVSLTTTLGFLIYPKLISSVKGPRSWYGFLLMSGVNFIATLALIRLKMINQHKKIFN